MKKPSWTIATAGLVLILAGIGFIALGISSPTTFKGTGFEITTDDVGLVLAVLGVIVLAVAIKAGVPLPDM